ncbi:two-component system sensor histidine kinase PgtB [Serratia aquatilis]|uniref:histidine kinase n=1 Tax=Serratia aquatilis TaxID=1737515 RepID=A0ABV6E8B8_9GAMM
MSRYLLRRMKRLTISTCLRGAFLTGAFLTLIVSGVSLYSWHEQSSQIRYALDDYFPRIQSSFVIESNLNTLVGQFNAFQQTANTTARLQLRNKIVEHLGKIERASEQLDSPQRQQIQSTLADSRQLLGQLDKALYNMFIAREKVNVIAARISWLHDDFTTELNSLVQDFSWQQSALLDQMEVDPSHSLPRLRASLREVQSEQQQVYTLARIENQITDALRDQLNKLQSTGEDAIPVEDHIRYLDYLKKTANENMRGLEAHPSTVTLRQTIDELLETGIAENSMPAAMEDYLKARQVLIQAAQVKETTLARFRTQLESQLSNSHRQMQTFNHRLEQIIRVSGNLILIATLLAMLLTFLLNHYFIRSRLIKRFTLLNQVVVRIGLGDTHAAIPIYGGDELGRIARLLRRTLGQLNKQKSRLEQEITERKDIEKHLRATQGELIQTAKLAVVGQTMTTLAHEINQPLNALSMYLFTARNAVDKGQYDSAGIAIAKADGLIGRMDAIIRMLRQFTRRTEEQSPCQPVDLRQSLLAAWELLALRHQPLKGELKLAEEPIYVRGDEVRIQQVLVNLMANALDACRQQPQIQVSWQRNQSGWQVMLWDNGHGWPLAQAESLLKPFTTSKQVGLGIGLSISLSLMQQMGGSLFLASTLTQNACVVLQFQPVD